MQYGNAEKEIKAEYTTKCPVDDDYNCGKWKCGWLMQVQDDVKLSYFMMALENVRHCD